MVEFFIFIGLVFIVVVYYIYFRIVPRALDITDSISKHYAGTTYQRPYAKEEIELIIETDRNSDEN